MANEIRNILEPWFQRLPELRGSPSLWQEFKYAPVTDKDTVTDANHQQRTNLLIALFYDQRSSDENLLRFLLKQDTEMLRHLSTHTDLFSLKICVALLSRFRNANNLELLLDAQLANSDIGNSFDTLAFLGQGVAKSYEHLTNLSEHHRKAFIEYLGPTPEKCIITEEEVDEWVNSRSGLLPGPLEKLTLEDEIFLADLLGDTTVRNNKITAWIASIKKWDRDHYTMLFNYELMRGNVQGQITALKKLGEYYEEGSIDKQMNFYTLSGLYLQAKETGEAYKNICHSLTHYAEAMQFVSCRMYVDRFLDIILAINNRYDPICEASFKWIKQYLDVGPWLQNWDIRIIPRIMTASTLAGDNDTMIKFSELFRARKKERDDAMKG